MDDALYIEIITPARIIFKSNIEAVTIPGVKGSFQILKNHAPLISIFETGLIKINVDEKTTKYYATGGGTIEVLNNNVLVLADSLEPPDEIDTERALQAKKRAEERLANKTKDTDIERAKAALRRAVNRLTLAEKHSGTEV